MSPPPVRSRTRPEGRRDALSAAPRSRQASCRADPRDRRRAPAPSRGSRPPARRARTPPPAPAGVAARRSSPARPAAGAAGSPAAGTRAPRTAGVGDRPWDASPDRSEEHTSELQSPCNLVCRLLLEKKKKKIQKIKQNILKYR